MVSDNFTNIFLFVRNSRCFLFRKIDATRKTHARWPKTSNVDGMTDVVKGQKGLIHC